jgi:hypothetical protein
MRNFKCPNCGLQLFRNEAGQYRNVMHRGHHTPGGEACVRVIVKRLGLARAALVSISKNTSEREPLAAAFADGTVKEMDEIDE